MAARQPPVRQHLHSYAGSPSSRGSTPAVRRCSPRPAWCVSEPLGPVVGIAIGHPQRARARARLDRERSDLVATVAHELRSPLTGVKGFVQALLNRWDKLSDDQRKLMLETVNADADRLVRLIAELLDVARIDTGRLRSIRAAVRRGRAGADASSTRSSAGTAAPIELEADRRGAGDLRRPRQVHPGRHQPRGERRPPRPGHGDGPPGARTERDVPGCGSCVDDEGEGIPEEMRQAGLHQVLEARRPAAAPAWGCTSSAGSRAPTAATSRHRGAPAGGARVMVDWPSEDQRPE